MGLILWCWGISAALAQDVAPDAVLTPDPAATQAPNPTDSVSTRAAQTPTPKAALKRRPLVPLPFAPQTTTGPSAPADPNATDLPSSQPAALLDLSPISADAIARLMPDEGLQTEPDGTAPETAENGLSESDLAAADGAADDAAPQAGLAMPVIIEAEPLTGQDMAEIGLLTEAESGFSTQIWAMSEPDALLAAWASAPFNAPSPTIVETLKALASAIASAPAVDENQAWALIDQRVTMLANLGDLKAANALMDRVPNDIAPDALLQRKADLALWADDWASACGAASAGIDRNPGPFWTNLTLACHALEGNQAAVDLLLEILPSKEQPDQQYMDAIDRLLLASTGRTPKPQDAGEALTPSTAQALSAAIAKRLNQPVKVTAQLVDAPAPIQASIAYSAGSSLAARWPGLAALAYRARVEPSDLLQFSLAAKAGSAPDPGLGLVPRYLARPLAIADETQRAQALLNAADQARDTAAEQIWARPIGTVFKSAQPIESLWPYAGQIAAHLAFAGAGGDTVQWYRHIRRMASPDDLTAARSVISIWPYALLLAAPGEIPFTPRLAQLWWQAQGAEQPDTPDDSSPASGSGFGPRAAQGIYVFTIFEALGYPMTPEIWATLGEASNYVIGGTAGDVEPAALEEAIGANEVGRGILLSFAALGNDGPVAPSPEALSACLRTLVALGQDDLARRLAAEVLFFNGVSRGNG
ncbi:MAG: hypothetical protein AAF607_10820 [Pseudomonadota bacterium]